MVLIIRDDMITQTVTVKEKESQNIIIGRRGTYQTEQIVFDVSYLVEAFGDGSAILMVKRPPDEAAYPANIARDGNSVIWTVSESDTFYRGHGEAEIFWYVDGGLAKSVIFSISILRDIAETTEDPPEAFPNWIEQLTELSAETEENAKQAGESAAAAAESEASAEASAETAAAAAALLKNVSAAAETLEPDQPASAEYDNGVFTFGIPKGPKGDKLTYADLTEADKADLVQGPIQEAQTEAVAAVNQAGTTQVANVNTAGSTQVENVNTAGANQVQEVEDKGEEVLATIPADYSKLSADVSDLKTAISDIDDVINFTSEEKDAFSGAWETGYVGVSRITTSSSNYDVYNISDEPIQKGTEIDLHLVSCRQYFYLLWVACDESLGYLSDRQSAMGNAKATSTDGTYYYYDSTITMPETGYLALSFRVSKDGVHIADTSLSTIKYTFEPNQIEINTKGIEKNASDISVNSAEIAELKTQQSFTQFPADDLLPIDVCHRGLCESGLPENTITAFKECVDNGWKWIETDVRTTSDGVFVLLHDATINRTARNPDGTAIANDINISDITYAQALEYDFGIYAGSEYAGLKIPTLDEFLNLCNKTHTYAQLEIKESDWIQEEANSMYSFIAKYRMDNKVMYLSSSYASIKKLLVNNPFVPCVQTGTSQWEYIDPSDFDDNTSLISYIMNYSTGKNKLFIERLMSSLGNKTLQDNYIDFFKHFGIYAGTYCPTTLEAMATLSDRFDIVCSQYVKYTEAKKDEIESV